MPTEMICGERTFLIVFYAGYAFEKISLEKWRRKGYRSATRDTRSHMMHAFSKIQPPHSNMDDIPHNDRIELAIADLESQECVNYAATA
jgi:hypothetical protein